MILEFKMSYMGVDPKIDSLPLGAVCSHCKGEGYFCRSGKDCPGDTDCVPEIEADRDPPV